MFGHSQFSRALAAGFAVVFVLGCVSTDLAQSGRRVQKSAPAPVSTPEPTPTPKAPAEKPKPRLTFLVGLDSHAGFANIPFYAYDGVLQSLTDRLSDAPSVHVGGTQTGMSRGEAIQKAKAEKEAYVVWLELEVDTMNPNRNTRDLDNIIIEYMVFAPTTAKIATSGRTYSQTQRNKGILNPRTSGIYGDRNLNQAAREAAERILSHFRLYARPDRPF
jgi:hypothetical protein